jgi:hypothetical protein
MRAIDRHKLKRILVHGDDAAAPASDAMLYSNLAAEVLQNVGKTVAQKQASDAAQKKAADIKKAQGDATAAAILATTEPDQHGPLHQAALAAAQKVGAIAAGTMMVPSGGLGGAPGGMHGAHANGATPTWVVPVAIGAGVLGVGLVLFKVLGSKRK